MNMETGNVFKCPKRAMFVLGSVYISKTGVPSLKRVGEKASASEVVELPMLDVILIPLGLRAGSYIEQHQTKNQT